MMNDELEENPAIPLQCKEFHEDSLAQNCSFPKDIVVVPSVEISAQRDSSGACVNSNKSPSRSL